MKFTPEFIQKQREIYSNAPTNVIMMVCADGNKLLVCYGYDEEFDTYEFGHCAEFDHPADAKYAHEALSNYPDALAEIERLREALEKYADRSNWWSHGDNGFPEQTVYEWQGEGDGTDIAREALKGGEG